VVYVRNVNLFNLSAQNGIIRRRILTHTLKVFPAGVKLIIKALQCFSLKTFSFCT
jgi:hypothetical protein